MDGSLDAEAQEEAEQLFRRAIDSLILAIELFNRPQDTCRSEAVLIQLQHAFEMLLKALIVKRIGTVFEAESEFSFTFDKCVTIAKDEMKWINLDESRMLRALDAQRDIAMHYYGDISEDLLYVLSQAAVTLFDETTMIGFGKHLADFLPSRVLPISTRPPRDMQFLLNSEFSCVDDLLQIGVISQSRAMARLRPVAALISGFNDIEDPPKQGSLATILDRRKQGDDWTIIFPSIAQLTLDTAGEGIPFYMKIKKDADIPVRFATGGETAAGEIIRHEINIFDKFTLGRDELAKKIGVSGPKTGALIIELGIKADKDSYREIAVNKAVYKRYSAKALQTIRSALSQGLDAEAVWQKHRHLFVKRKAT